MATSRSRADFAKQFAIVEQFIHQGTRLVADASAPVAFTRWQGATADEVQDALKRELMSRLPETANVAVIGSGSVASSVIRYLGKRASFPIRVASRCPENAMQLAMEFGGFGTGLDQLAHLLNDVEGIITATAAPHAVLYGHHLAGACSQLRIGPGGHLRRAPARSEVRQHPE